MVAPNSQAQKQVPSPGQHSAQDLERLSDIRLAIQVAESLSVPPLEHWVERSSVARGIVRTTRDETRTSVSAVRKRSSPVNAERLRSCVEVDHTTVTGDTLLLLRSVGTTTATMTDGTIPTTIPRVINTGIVIRAYRNA
jgi:hypothetical protein